MLTRSFFIACGILLLASLFAVYPISRVPVSAAEAGRIADIKHTIHSEKGWGVEQGISILASSKVIGDTDSPTAHLRLRWVSWFGFVVSGFLMVLLWNLWQWPMWPVAVGWCVAAGLPGAWPTLQTVPLLSWTLAIVLVSLWLILRSDKGGPAIGAAVIWAFLLWWAPDLWVFWFAAYIWVVLSTDSSARGAMVTIFALSILAGVTTVLILDRTSASSWSFNIPNSTIFWEEVAALFRAAPLAMAIVLVGFLDAVQGRANPGGSSRGSYPVVGGILSFLWLDFDVVSSLVLIVSCAAMSIWWMRMAYVIKGNAMKILCAVAFLSSLLPFPGVFNTLGVEATKQAAVFEKLLNSDPDTPLLDETFTVYFRPNLLDPYREANSEGRLSVVTTLATGIQLHPGAFWYIGSSPESDTQDAEPALYGMQEVGNGLWITGEGEGVR